MRPVEATRDHVRGGPPGPGVTELVLYGDYLCPYCRRLRHVLRALREKLGARMAYVFRHFPNEHAHPGATFASRAAEAAGLQGRFWEMHDSLYAREPPLGRDEVLAIVRTLDLDEEKFAADLEREDIGARIEEDLADGQRAGAVGTPTVFIDGVRYGGAWDYFSMLEACPDALTTFRHRPRRPFRRGSSLTPPGGPRSARRHLNGAQVIADMRTDVQPVLPALPLLGRWPREFYAR
jgi:NhaA family Na+:H+ antiporter